MDGGGPVLVIAVRSISSPVQRVLKLKPGEYRVGRDPTCDIVVPDPYVSRVHARIVYRDGRWYVEDLGSRNGTYVNGEDVRGRGAVDLGEGVEVVVGFSVLTVSGFES